MMNPVIKQKWIEALRSGEYSQAKFRLYDGQSYCCLGVLCDLYLKENNQEWTVLSNTEENIDEYYIAGQSETLPRPVRGWAGIEDSMPKTPLGTSLIALNDDEDYTFSLIADVIEAEL